MTTQRDANRIVRSWLHEEQYETADRILESALLQIDTTPQRRPPWPARRFADMNTYAKLAIAAAAVVVVALAGFRMLPAGDGNVGVSPTASPPPSTSASLAPTSAPTATPSDPPFFPAGPIESGRHSIVLSGESLSLDFPRSGWISNGTFRTFAGAGHAAFIFWTDPPTNVYSDPCTQQPLDPPAGDTPGELAAAVSSIPGTDLVEGPTDATIGGQPAKVVSIRIREDVDCSNTAFSLWYSGEPSEGRWPDTLGETVTVWIIDVDGTIVWIDGSVSPNATPTLPEEMQQIVESIRFE